MNSDRKLTLAELDALSMRPHLTPDDLRRVTQTPPPPPPAERTQPDAE